MNVQDLSTRDLRNLTTRQIPPMAWLRVPSTIGPIAIRTSRNVGCPTAAVMRRTCRFSPSRSVISSQAVGTFLRDKSPLAIQLCASASVPAVLSAMFRPA